MSKERVLQRVEANLDHLQQAYPTADRLLHDAMQEASAWVLPLVTGGKVPSVTQLERLATQLLAIVVASDSPKP